MGAQCSVKRPPKEEKKTAPPSQNSVDDIRDIYIIGEVLGSGAFGEVRECTMRNPGPDGKKEIRAVKIMENQSETGGPWSNWAMFKREVDMLSKITHPHIIKYFDFFEDEHFLYAVMEKCSGGELFDQICKRRRFTEQDAAVLCKQMLSALAYIHDRGIVHRDVKAENFLFEDKTPTSCIKMIDFGMSAKISPGTKLSEVCGSPHYLSPELLRKAYDTKADMWALGVLVFLMLYGKYPFDGKDTREIVRDIIHKKIPALFEHPKYVYSQEAVSFLLALLNRDPEARLTAKQALQHPWVAKILTPAEAAAAAAKAKARGAMEIAEALTAAASGQTSTDAATVPMEAVRKAQRKVTLARQTGRGQEAIARRAQLLQKLNQEYEAGVRQSLRFTTDGRTNKANTRGDILVDGRSNYKVRPEYSRADKRLSTSPGRIQVDPYLALELAALAAIDDNAPYSPYSPTQSPAVGAAANPNRQFSAESTGGSDWATAVAPNGPVSPLALSPRAQQLPIQSKQTSAGTGGFATTTATSPGQTSPSRGKGFQAGSVVASPPMSPAMKQSPVGANLNPLSLNDGPDANNMMMQEELAAVTAMAAMARKSKRASTSHVMSQEQENEARKMAADLVRTFQESQKKAGASNA